MKTFPGPKSSEASNGSFPRPFGQVVSDLDKLDITPPKMSEIYLCPTEAEFLCLARDREGGVWGLAKRLVSSRTVPKVLEGWYVWVPFCLKDCAQPKESPATP
ncbi:hypothetical protein KW797_02300 [Candidatus Parcubacteria bacterium]|nr:hypothetical protein [Candidatus Parcubacteria bacterium]